jgi:hypothetical protein
MASGLKRINPYPNRARAEYMGGTKIRLTWPCGTKRTKDYSKGPVAKRVGEWGCKFYANYWNRSGGVTAPCPKHGKWADSCPHFTDADCAWCGAALADEPERCMNRRDEAFCTPNHRTASNRALRRLIERTETTTQGRQ